HTGGERRGHGGGPGKRGRRPPGNFYGFGGKGDGGADVTGPPDGGPDPNSRDRRRRNHGRPGTCGLPDVGGGGRPDGDGVSHLSGERGQFGVPGCGAKGAGRRHRPYPLLFRQICPGLEKPLCLRDGEIRGGMAGLSHSKRSYERYPKGGGPSGKSRPHVSLGGPVRIAEPLPSGGGIGPECGEGSAGPAAGKTVIVRGEVRARKRIRHAFFSAAWHTPGENGRRRARVRGW